jgi:hypothetical protein
MKSPRKSDISTADPAEPSRSVEWAHFIEDARRVLAVPKAEVHAIEKDGHGKHRSSTLGRWPPRSS